MGLGDVLFGRKKLKAPAAERLFAISTAAVTLDTSCSLTTAGVGAVIFKPLSAGEFTAAEQEIEQLLQAVATSSGSTLDRKVLAEMAVHNSTEFARLATLARDSATAARA